MANSHAAHQQESSLPRVCLQTPQILHVWHTQPCWTCESQSQSGLEVCTALLQCAYNYTLQETILTDHCINFCYFDMQQAGIYGLKHDCRMATVGIKVTTRTCSEWKQQLEDVTCAIFAQLLPALTRTGIPAFLLYMKISYVCERVERRATRVTPVEESCISNRPSLQPPCFVRRTLHL